MLLAHAGFAQSYSIVGSGTTSNDGFTYPAPYGNYWWGARHQLLVTAAELSAAGVPSGSSISSIGFNVTNTNNSAAHTDWQVKVYTTTTANPISTNWLTTGLVAQSTATTASPTVGWNQTMLNSSFVWDGTSHLVIETCFNNASYLTNVSQQWTTNLSGNTYSRWFRSDATGVCANTATTSTSTTTRPNIRFAWTGGAPCDETPTPGATTSSASSVCPGTNFTVGVTNPAFGSGVTYQWQVSTTGASGPWTDVGGNSSAFTTSLTQESWYQAIVTCDGEGSGTSTPVQVSVNSYLDCYCTSGASFQWDGAISNVTVGPLNNTSNCTVPAPGPGSILNQYANYKTLPATLLMQGQSVPYSVTANTCNGNYGVRVAMFIDWNQNGLLTDPGEQIFISDLANSPYTTTGVFTVPFTAPPGLTLMRVIQVQTAGAILPCGTYNYGETEDYLIDVQEAVPCAGPPLPGNTTASNTTPCSGSPVNLSVQNQTLGTGVTYQWQVSTDGSSGPWTDFGPNEPFTTVNPTVDSWYQVIVTCTETGGGTATSTPVEVEMASFLDCYCTANLHQWTWPCITNVNFGNTLSNPSPTCSSTYTSYAGGAANTTGVFERGVAYTLSTTTTDVASVSVWIDYDQSGTFDANEWVAVQTTTNNGTVALTIPVTAELGLTGMRVRTNYTWSQPNGAGDACTHFTYGETEDYQITIAPEPSCLAPGGITTTFLSTTAATIAWTDNGAEEYFWEVRTTGAPGTPGAYATGTTTGTTFSLTGLTPSTTYRIYIMSDCGDVDGLSSWSAQHTIFTGYCGGSTPGPTTVWDTNILSVFLPGEETTINNATPCPGVIGVQNFIAQSTTLIPGNSYSLTVDFGSCGSGYPSVGEAWIDWNQNMVFDPAESLGAFQETAFSTLLGVRTFQFTVPLDAVIGNTVMRVMHHETSVAPPLNPCASYAYGAMHDYGISVCAPPVATASVTDDCVNEEFTIDVDGGTANYTILYSVDGGAQQSAPYTGTILTLGPFPTTALVDVVVSAGPGCVLELGGFASNCPIIIDCDATSALTMTHCYTNNDGRTFTFVSSDPNNTLVFKFLQPSPIEGGDGVTFYDGDLNTGIQIGLPPAGGDLSSLGTIVSTGNTLSFSIQSDAEGSCVDGGVSGNWTFQIRCAGCVEPSADPIVTTDCSTMSFNLQVDLWDLGFSDITGLPTTSASIQYTVNGVTTTLANVTEDIYDLGDFGYNDVVNVVVLHEDDGACNLVLGNFTHNAPCPPINDQCAAALPLTVNGPTGCPGNAISGTTQYADMTGSVPVCASGATIADVWYTFNTGTSMSPMTITLVPGSAHNVGYQVFTACGTPWGGTGGCTATVNGTATITGLTQNSNYWLRVFTRTNLGAAGTFNVCLSANNAATLCDGAINIPSAPVTNQALVCGTQNLLNPTTVPTTCGSGSTTYTGGLEAIYTFTPAVTGTYIISYSGQSWTSINVHANACPSAGGTCVGAIANSLTSKTLIVPMTAGTLYYIWFDTWPSPPSACPGTFSLMMETCSSATGVTATAITHNSASINWTGTPGNYIIEYGPSASFTTPGTGATAGVGGTIVTTSTWPYTLTTLLSSTQYRVFVRRDCTGSGDGYSINSPQLFFTTAAAPPTPPVCNALWYDSGGPAANYANNENWTFTLCPDPGDVVTINFNSFNTETNWDRLYIYDGASTAAPKFSSGNGAGFGSSPYGDGGWWGTTIPGPFTSTIANGGCMTFAFWSDGSVVFPGWEAMITCGPPPTCPPPTSLSLVSLTSTSATVNWNGDAGTYIVEYGPSGTFFTPGITNLPGVGGTVVTTTTWPFEITGLTADTEYRAFVRRDCSASGDGYSMNSNSILFNTGGCTNPWSFWQTLSAPAAGGSTTMNCISANEYGIFSGANVGQEYTVTTTNANDFITVRSGSSNGPSVAMGSGPLTFTSPVSGNLYVHVNTNASCGNDWNCRNLTMTSPAITCENEVANGSSPAPALGDSETNTGVAAGEYTVFTNAVAGQIYVVSSSVGTDALTVRSGTFNGPVVASGIGTLTFNAPSSTDLFVHVNSDADCGSDITGRNITMEAISPECTNTSPFGSSPAPAPGNSSTNFGVWAGEYTTFTAAAAGQQYTVTSTISTDFLTVRSGTSGGPVVISGITPLTFTTTTAGDLFVHVNTDTDCGTQSSSRNITLSAALGACAGVVCPPGEVCVDGDCVPVECQNDFQYGNNPAPTPGNSTTVGCSFTSEYSTWTSVVAGEEYTVSSSVATDFLTVRSGTFNGPVVASGITPITFTATSGDNLYVHVNADANCGSDGNCHDITMSVPAYVMLTSMAMLDGAFESATGLMRDDLRVGGHIPTAHPYAGAPFNHTGSETIDAGVLDVTGNDAIVDWVLLELRDETTPTTIVATRAALIQRDGDIVDTDGVSSVKFPGVAPGDYHLVVRHRNHLAVMTAESHDLNHIPTDIDLTAATTATYGTDARRTVGSMMTLWSGNVNADAQVTYSGADNDRTALLNTLGASTYLDLMEGYYDADVNMSGAVTYSGASSDRATILNTLGASTYLTPIEEQLP